MAKNKDPFADREAEKYKNPVPSREFIIQYLFNKKIPLNLQELYKELKINSAERKEALRLRIIAMLRDGQLEQLNKKKYWPIGKKNQIQGLLHFDKRGTLWCTPEQGGSRFPVMYSNREISLHGSKAIVSIPDAVELTETKGRIVKILQKNAPRVIGRFIQGAEDNYVIPHGKDIVQDIVIPSNKQKHAKDGDIVLVEILEQSSTWRDLIGKVVEVIGHENAKGIEVNAAIHAYSISHQWTEDIVNEIENISEKQDKNKNSRLLKNRVDLRELPLVTIDGEDAKDFDDAVFCEPTLHGGWRLYVAIADVSYYVHLNSNLDKEAKLRGNSIYFPGKVIPMLPAFLSNDLCSLVEGKERLCVVCEMTINKKGELTKYQFYEGIMKSHARLTYTKVAKILSGESKHLLDTYVDLVEDLQNLNALYTALSKHRKIIGALDFDTVETNIIFDRQGKIKAIEPTERNIAHHIIEECMLCANVATARFLIKHKLPALYRVHEGPTEDKLADLKAFLHELGLSFGKKEKLTSLDYGKVTT